MNYRDLSYLSQIMFKSFTPPIASENFSHVMQHYENDGEYYSISNKYIKIRSKLCSGFQRVFFLRDIYRFFFYTCPCITTLAHLNLCQCNIFLYIDARYNITNPNIAYITQYNNPNRLILISKEKSRSAFCCYGNLLTRTRIQLAFICYKDRLMNLIIIFKSTI